MNHDIFRIAIIGAGPRGLSVLERLNANIREEACLDKIDIHVVDPYPPGAGKVWRTEQPHTLLMNTVASQITLFTDFSVDCKGPIMQGPSLYEWAQTVANTSVINLEYDTFVMDEAKYLEPDSYPTRAFYGYYLDWVFKKVTISMPDNVNIFVHQTRAVAIDEAHDDSQIIRLENDVHLRVNVLVLAQGHTSITLSQEEEKIKKIADSKGLIYITPCNPADISLDSIKPGEPVILKGLGLNFFDYMALFTQGRGGKFVKTGEKLVYHPSGNEPKIYAGSRRGIPYHARGENEKGADGRHEPFYITEEVINSFHQKALEKQPINFKIDIWPLICKEVETIYYKTLIKEKHDTKRSEEFLEYYIKTSTPQQESIVLEKFGISDDLKWDWEKLSDPCKNKIYNCSEEFKNWMVNYLKDDLIEAKKGNITSPLKSALDAFRDLRNEVRLLVDYSGIDGESYKYDLRQWYTSMNAFFSIGPPALRIEQMIALIEAGIVEIIGPKVQVELLEEESVFQAKSPYVTGSVIKTRVLIEARLPEPSLKRTADPLMAYLIKTKQCETYKIPTQHKTTYDTDGLAVNKMNKMLDVKSNEHSRRFAFGVPTEGVHWVTAAGIRPGVNSVTLSESDAIARDILVLLEKEQNTKEMNKVIVKI